MPAKPSSLPLWATNGGRVVEPLLAEKQQGWENNKQPPARWMNWLDNLNYQWTAWLDAFEATPHIWTAPQTFLNAAVAFDADNTGAAFKGVASNTATAGRIGVEGDAGTGDSTSFGVKGLGAARTGAGSGGVNGIGGTGTTTGGLGGKYVGGAGTGAGSNGGEGVTSVGGAVDGSTNTTGAAGRAGTFTGGAVSSDANHRVGGDALKATGGLGQDGYGRALYADHGGIVLDEGAIIAANAPSVLGSGTQIDGNGTVNGDLTVLGLIINGVRTAPTYVNSWADAYPGGTPSPVAFWKDKFNEVSFEGIAAGGATNTHAFVLPLGFRPPYRIRIPVACEGATETAMGTAQILTDGKVLLNFPASNGNVSLFGVKFRL